LSRDAIVLGIVGSARRLAAGGSAPALAVAVGGGLFLFVFFTVHWGADSAGRFVRSAICRSAKTRYLKA